MSRCTHTSDWHKDMKTCSVCGTPYTDEESMLISEYSTRVFSADQELQIERMKSESYENDD